MILHRDFKELLRLLHSYRVRFIIVGAHALAAHGRPRYTGDLDVFVEPTPANAKRVIAALTEFGFGSLGLTERDFTQPDQVIQLGYPPARVDVLTGISGVSFATAWKHRLTVPVGGQRLPFLGAEQFVANKRAAGRPKDQADIALLEEARRDTTRRPRQVSRRR